MSAADAGAVVRRWLAGPLPREVVRPLDRLAATPGIARVAVLPDVHYAEGVCVGVAAASRDRLFPEAVGGDIGCGMAAVRFDAPAAAVADERVAARVLAGLRRAVPSNRRGGPGLDVADRALAALDSEALSDERLARAARRDGRVELGTLGRGNHFLELQADDEGALWLMVHSGSRAVGPAILAHHLAHARTAETGLRWLDAGADAGRAYLADVAWAVAYAEASRRLMADAAAALLADVAGVRVEDATYRSSLHNHVRAEACSGETLLVHRKGSISAREGEPGIVPGSMGTWSFHTLGRGCEEALCSSSHGAGRALSRSEARRRIPLREFRREMRGVVWDARRERDLVDEAPSAYKDVGAVMRAQRDLTRIERRLRPVLSYKGGSS